MAKQDASRGWTSDALPCTTTEGFVGRSDSDCSLSLQQDSLNSHRRISVQKWYGVEPQLSHLRVWGCMGYAQIPLSQRKKWDPKVERVRLLGYPIGQKAYRLLILKTNKVVVRRDVVFDEHIFSTRQEQGGATQGKCPQQVEFPLEVEEMPADQGPAVEEMTDDATQNSEDEVENPPSTPQPEQQHQSPIRQSTRQRRSPIRFGYDEYANCIIDNNCDEFALAVDGEPQSWQEAMERPDAEKWRLAAEAEFQSLQRNDTWDLVKLPAGCKAVTSKWVFRLKRDAEGKITRYKARLVARGFTQRAGIDYQETFAPVVRFETVRVIIAAAAKRGLLLHQLDVETAFLNGTLQEEVYLEQPEGFVEDTTLVCRLRKSLYGLKQSPRCWNQALHEFLLEKGYKQTQADTCVYTYKSNILAVYVDDLLLVAPDEQEIARMKKGLMDRFKMKDLGPLHYLLGLRIVQDVNGVHIDQKNYINCMVDRFGLKDANVTMTPADTNVQLKAEDGVSNKVDRTGYQKLVSSLLYAAVGSRPDIAQAVSYVCRYTSDPNEAHATAAKRILRYLKGMAKLGLYYRRGEKKDDLHGYCDADWAGDRESRRSTTGHVFLLGGAAVSWLAQRQPVVALSSTEAEYIALSSAAQQVVWLRRLLYDIGMERKEPTNLYEDNQGAICLAKNPVAHRRTKHIDIRHHFVREQVATGSIKIEYVSTKEQVADVLTKPLPRDAFEQMRVKLGLVKPRVT